MADRWFYLNPIAEKGATAALDAREARHALGARRLSAGDSLTLFDGEGTVAEAVIDSVGSGRKILLRIVDRTFVDPPRPLIHLATALPKGDRLSTLLSMAAQLGMNGFSPLVCERSVVKPPASAVDRWRKIMIEACKQSRRPHLPAIHGAATPAEVVRGSESARQLILVAHPGGENLLGLLQGADPEEIVCIVGPEGGFTEGEMAQMLESRARAVNLGDGILRTETAAVVMVAATALTAGNR